MPNSFLHIISFLAVGIILSSCGEEKQPEQKITKKPASESLVKANRYLLKQEKEDIHNYIRRHGWKMHETGSGLFYQVVEKGSGRAVREKDIVVVEYTTRLITGDIVYSSKESGPKSFVVGHGGVESGLEEGVLLLHEGDKARLIIPAHLALGLLGDQKKIPARSTLVYELELIELK